MKPPPPELESEDFEPTRLLMFHGVSVPPSSMPGVVTPEPVMTLPFDSNLLPASRIKRIDVVARDRAVVLELDDLAEVDVVGVVVLVAVGDGLADEQLVLSMISGEPDSSWSEALLPALSCSTARNCETVTLPVRRIDGDAERDRIGARNVRTAFDRRRVHLIQPDDRVGLRVNRPLLRAVC